MGFFETFWTWLNGQLNTYIGNNTALIANALEPAVVTFATIYVVLWGYLHLTGGIEQPFAVGLKRIVTLAIVFGVGIRLWLYNSVIVDTFYTAPAELATAVVGAGDPVTVIDAIWDRGGAVADFLFHKGGVLGWQYIFVGVIVWALIGLLCVYTMFLIALASIALAVLLALGPLFIPTILFDRTRRLFDAWLGQLATYSLITILTVLVAALLLQIVRSYADQTAALGQNLVALDTLNMLLISALSFLLMRQVMPIAAGLGGGIALSSFSTVSGALRWGARQPKQALESYRRWKDSRKGHES
jgi:type IV secretion system protein VirB6